VRLDPGNNNIMMLPDILEKVADVPNDDHVASAFDGVVPEEAHAIFAVGDQNKTSANGHGGCPIRGTNPLEGMVTNTDFTGVAGRAKGPDPIWIRLISNHWAPEQDRGSEGASQVSTPPRGP